MIRCAGPRMRRRGRFWVAWVLTGLMFGGTVPARAADGEWVLGASAGHSVLIRGDSRLVHAPTAETAAWLGLTDALWLAASSSAAWRLGSLGDDRAARTMGTLEAGIVVALDVFRTMPFLELMGGASLGTSVEPTFRVGLGAEYFVSRTISLGGVLRFRPIWEDNGRASMLTGSIRVSTRFEI
ncbi:MAG: hypothetical protein IPK13_20075 [Deltaproteobacteria bacterium]|nr:hypothetical protein [Deltaproteobacteria bacterium]